MEEFQLSKFTKEGEQLLNDVRVEFKNLNMNDSILPKVFSDDNDKIKLVFVGQYSAGKSSIIKMLTGEDLAIGAKITTQSASTYSWNGLEIIDTPGIHTELRPDHDELTYEQINHAALLIFVITNEGFSQRLGDHFRTLAIDQKRAGNMILIVNKMDRASQGNTPEQQQIIAKDLEKVTQPYNPSDLYLSFLDTTSYFKGLEETDERRKARRFERSGHDVFIDNLNKFVKEHKTLAKVTKPLYTIADILRSIIENGNNNKDNAVVVFTGTIEHRKDLAVEAKKQYQREVSDIVRQFKNDIDRIGRNAAINALDSGSQETANKIIEEANESVAATVKDYTDKINECAISSSQNLGTAIQTYEKSSFIQQVNNSMEQQIKNEIKIGNVLPGGALAALGALTGQYAAQIAAPFAEPAKILVETGFTKLTPLVEKLTTVLVGSEYGKTAGVAAGKGVGWLWRELSTKTVTLPPTMTNKIAQFVTANAGKIGAAMSVLGVAWTLYSLYSEEQKRREAELKQRIAREKIIAGFNRVGDDVSLQLIESARQWSQENIDPIINDYDNSIKQIQADQEKAKITSERFGTLLNRTENLISEIQNSN